MLLLLVDEWLIVLHRAWTESLENKEVLNLSMLLRDLVAYGKQKDMIGEEFAEDVGKKIVELEELRPEMSPPEVSKSLRAILYATRHTREYATNYGTGFQSPVQTIHFTGTPGTPGCIERVTTPDVGEDVETDDVIDEFQSGDLGDDNTEMDENCGDG